MRFYHAKTSVVKSNVLFPIQMYVKYVSSIKYNSFREEVPKL